ncbi:MAG TPA: DUF1415 family protein [Polyangia bacterium]|nr:DUF1415 family protein [Polyangia bacterium]
MGESEHDARSLSTWRREALRLNDRYLREVVLGFGLCPWAERAIADGEVRREVVLSAAPSLDAALGFIDQLAHAGQAAAVGMLIFPRALSAPAAFDRYAEQVRRADRERSRAEGRQDFVMAAFHPDGADSFATPYQLVSFLRRAPDPMIQLVRAPLLDRLRATRPALSEDVAAHNFATVNARGPAALDAVLGDIRRDREQTYAKLAAADSAVTR